jgi:hypothetical protein
MALRAVKLAVGVPGSLVGDGETRPRKHPQ